jgi:MtN3 and saliva related transmembrane protein
VKLYSVETIGVVAGTLTTGAYFPQLVNTWRTRNARGLTYPMLVILSTGLFLWLIYGLMIHSPSVIWADGVTLVFALFILGLKIHFERREARRESSVPDMMAPESAR